MRRPGWLLALLLFWLPWPPVLAETREEAGATDVPGQSVLGLRLGRIPGRTRLVLDLSASPDYQWSEGSAARDEVVLLLSGAHWGVDVSPRLFEGSPIAGLRREQAPGADELRVVLALHQPRQVRVFSLKPHAGHGHRLVVDLFPPRSEEAPVESAGDVAPASAAVAETGSAVGTKTDAALPPARSSGSRGALPGEPPSPGWVSGLRVSGYGELSSAYTVASPSHWSQLRARVEAAVSGSLGSELRFKLAGRAQGDAAFSLEDDYYPAAVRDDQRSEFSVREAWLDAGAGDWQFRLGRQHIVWGEMVGLFLADVVSARDMREFYLQEFDAMRIPQWAVRAERFAGNSHLELLWIPHPSYDEIGEPGADFYPFPVPAGVPVRHDRPARNLGNSHWGLRASHLVAGWDLSGFYYQGQDVAPTLYSTPTGLELRNERLKQLGATFSKDFYSWVLRGEAVHTTGRHFYTAGPGALGGFAPEASESLDYVLGVTIPRGDWRIDLQFYGRHLFQYRQDMPGDANETGFTALVNYGFGQRLEWEVLYLSGLNRSDWSLQPRLLVNLTPEWRLQVGADLFGGDPVGLFGQFDQSDRLYLELRRWF